MCEQTEISYLDGEVVWVKLGSCWWPGEVIGAEKLPPDVLPSFRKPPIAVVKFFQESTYEYVKNINSIYKYNCSRKNEFIKKGLYMYRSKHGHMEKFPEDVIRAETEVGGDPDVLTRDEFQEAKKESYAGLFGSASKRTPIAGRGRGKPPITPKSSTPVKRVMREKSDYKVHILVQGSKTPSQPTDASSTPSTSRAGSESEAAEEKTPKADRAAAAPAGVYPCPLCAFSTTRLNVLILHNKTHSATFTPYTPSPIRNKPIAKSSPKATPNKTPKARKPRKEKAEKVKKSQPQKRSIDEQTEAAEVKKAKTDEEIKSSLLADWDDESDGSRPASPAPPHADEPIAGEPIADEPIAEEPIADKPIADKPIADKPHADKPHAEPAADKHDTSDSKYEFCEDEDWSLEADAGRKIPRVKNPAKRKEERKSISIDEDDVAREVAELLNRTTVPELPTAPEPLAVEENFPEPSIVKSPDKSVDGVPVTSKDVDKPATDVQPTRAIFKTKTFFRSRHSRSQDAIGKYVAEQLNAAERMDAESELNGSDIVASSPEHRESPPVEHVKVARLAPKIQLKKMKAEAAQLREKEKISLELTTEEKSAANGANTKEDHFTVDTVSVSIEKENVSKSMSSPLSLDVLYPTQEIKPINKDIPYELPAKGMCDKLDKLFESTSNKDEICGNDRKTDKNNDDINSNLNESNPQKTSKQLTEPFMNESTASAVDALLSVSREADRVTKTISDDLPEDLFEDDNKDNGGNNNVNNGFSCNPTEEYEIENTKEQKPVEAVEPLIQEKLVVQEVPMTDSINENDKIVAQHNDDVLQHDNLHKPNDYLTPNNVIVENIIPSIENNSTAEVHCETLVDNIPSESDLQIAEALINLPATAIKNKPSTVSLATHFSSEPFQEEIIQSTSNVDVDDDKICESNRSEEKSTVEPIIEPMESSNGDDVNTRYETELEKSENLYAAQSLVEMSCHVESVEHKINVSESKLPEMDSASLANTVTTIQSKHIESSRSVEQKVASLSSDNNSDLNNSNVAKFETSSSKLLKILEESTIPKIVAKTPTKQTIITTGKEKILNFDVSKASIKGKPQSPKQKIIIRRNTPGKTVINSVGELVSPDNIILSRSSQPPDGAVQTYTIQSPADAGAVVIQQKLRRLPKPAPKLHKLRPQYSLVADDALYDINSMPVVLSDDILTPESIENMPIVMSDGKIITSPANPPKLVKAKHAESDKVAASPSKPETKTLLMNPAPEVSKATTPNILSKSAKLRGSKPMLVIDKATGKQKIIMTKAEPAAKETKPEAGKFIILPAGAAAGPRPARTQKIVIDPQTGKAHVLVSKPEPAPDNKPVSAKLVPQPDAPGNTVMIITNAQGAQSRIVLTPEHERILFPNKQPKALPRVAAAAAATRAAAPAAPAPRMQNAKIFPKQQKSAIITSKGQLIVGGRVATTAQNIAPAPPPEPRARPRPAAERRSEPLIFLQQKSGQVLQLTAAQFEQLQRTGQIVQKTTALPEAKVAQKTIAVPTPAGAAASAAPRKPRRPAAASPTPAKRPKHEVPIAPAPAPAPLPALAPLAPAPAPYPELDNLEELLPTTAIVRPEPAPAPEPPPAPLGDGQLLAVPGEHFGGPPGSFYLCVEDNGALAPIDNRPLVLENNQLVPMGPEPAPERRDILEAALANSDVFEPPGEPPFRDLNANVSVHCRVSETSSAQQPIMAPAEAPRLGAAEPAASLEAGLAVIGVTPAVPTTLELPITVTDPRIAPRAADPLAPPEPELFADGVLPLLLDDAAGKSMPLLTDEPAPLPRHAAAS